jgi:RNA polymerase sigma factor (sigma-70 family)
MPQPVTPSDQEIDQQILSLFATESSRESAFRLLMRTYQQRVYWHIRKMVIDHDEADELVQQTFIRAWQGLSRFRGDAALFTWLYRIASNVALTHLAKQRKRFFLPIHDITAELEQKLTTSITHESAESMEVRLQKAILRLPDKQRLVFNMRYYDDLSYEQISAIVGTSVGALKASYHHAQKKVEEFLKQY